MSSPTDRYQQYTAPEWFNDELKRVGGENPYGEALFKVVWGMGGQPEALYRAGGSWHVEGEPSFTGYRDLLVGGGTESWCLLQWDSPEFYGSPESFYVMNYDQESGLQDLGEFPYQGKYRLLYNLCWRDMSSGKMKIEAMPLNSFILDCVVPIILQAKDISYEKTKAVLRDQKEKEDKADLDRIEDAMRDSSLAFKGPVSYARQGCRTSIVDRKVEQMTRNWNKMVTNARTLGRGLSARATDPTI
jgi:hypothetical protein